MQHYAAFHLGLHCMPKYSFRVFQYTGELVFLIYSKTYVKQPLKNKQNKGLNDGLENQFLVFLRVAVLNRFYCTSP